MSITVRRATISDRDAIVAVHRAAAVTPGALRELFNSPPAPK